MFRLTIYLVCEVILMAQTPDHLAVPADQKLLLQLHGAGTQIYDCQNNGNGFKWVFKAPDAKLFNSNGTPAGKHFAGPTWELIDGSRITGKVVNTLPSPDANAIPWLLLTVQTHAGQGLLDTAKSIQRLNTKGGKMPQQACSAETEVHELAVPYEADYHFFG